MTDQQMEDLVERIIQRLRPPVLVMVTRRATGTLFASGWPAAASLHLALDSGIDDGEQWRAIGKTLPAADWQGCLRSRIRRCAFRPPAGGGSGGRVPCIGPVARAYDALLSGLPVLALRYHCDPAMS